MNAITRAVATVKALTTMRWSRTGHWWSMLLGSSSFDYRGSAGDGRTNAAVMACVRWAQRALPEAPLTVVTRAADGELTPQPAHPLQLLFERPNAYYSGLHLVGALVADLMLTGNAYCVKLRSAQRRVVELWWVPSTVIEPAWPDDGSVYISHYAYQVEGQTIEIDPADVVHIRQGFDPHNIRKGLSDLVSLYREIATDNEAANWTGSLLRNGAVPGVIISPEGDVSPSQEDLEDVKTKFLQRFGGDNRGAPLVMRGATRVQTLSFNPNEMNLRDVRNIPEERITAVFGIPAAVVGLGTGLEQTKVGATLEAYESQAYRSCLIPLQRLLVAELMMQLVPDFGDPATLRAQFDLSQVRVLQDDQNALHERARADLLAGLVTLNQALGMIGSDPVDGEAGDVRYLPNTVTVKTVETLIPEAPPADPFDSAQGEPTPLPAEQDEDEDEDEEDERAAAMARPALSRKARTADDALADRYEAGLVPLEDDLAAELLDEFDELAAIAAGRAVGIVQRNGHSPAEAELKADAVPGLVGPDDHDQIARLLRVYVLRGMRQAALDLAPVVGTTVRIQRNTPAVRAAVADMEARLPGIATTTADDFGRLLRRLERRPGSLSADALQSAFLEYVEQAYPARSAMIAATELGAAHARGVLHVAEKTGIERVHIADGDGDAACRERNGTVLPLSEAAGVGLLHPHCRLRVIPVLSPAPPKGEPSVTVILPPPGRTLVSKLVERDELGQIVRLTEVHETAGPNDGD